MCSRALSSPSRAIRPCPWYALRKLKPENPEKPPKTETRNSKPETRKTKPEKRNQVQVNFTFFIGEDELIKAQAFTVWVVDKVSITAALPPTQTAGKPFVDVNGHPKPIP